MKLSEFKENIEKKEKIIKNSEKISKNDEKDSKNDENIEKLYNIYKNMNQNELMTELLSKVKEQKKDGTFNYNQLQNSVSQLAPFLNKEQQNNLMSILEKLK